MAYTPQRAFIKARYANNYYYSENIMQQE